MKKLRLQWDRKLSQGDNKWQSWPTKVLLLLKASEWSPPLHTCPHGKNFRSLLDQFKYDLRSLLPRQSECIYLGVYAHSCVHKRL